MERRVLFLAWICILVATRTSADLHKSSQELFNALSSDIQKELGKHTKEIHNQFLENVIGEQYHQVYDFRVIMYANSHQCYYQEAEPNTTISVTYETVHTPTFRTSAKVAASVSLVDEGGKSIAINDQQSSGEIEFETETEGTYALCLSNPDTRNPLTVQIDIDIWRPAEISNFHENMKKGDDAVFQASTRVYQVTRLLALIRHGIKHTHSLLHYDYLTVISNQSRVNNYSILSLVLIASICFIQLRVVKSFFGSQTTNV